LDKGKRIRWGLTYINIGFGLEKGGLNMGLGRDWYIIYVEKVRSSMMLLLGRTIARS
jgi:hypothetical protein